MKKKNLFLKMVVSGLFVSSTAFAGGGAIVQDSADLARSIFKQNVNPDDPNKKESGSKTGGPMGHGTTINQGSYTGQNSQNAGSAANAAAGAALIASGTALLPPPTTPTGAMLIGLGILAMLQSGHDSNAAGKSGMSAAASDFQNKSATTGSPYGTGDSQFNDPKVKAAAAKIAEMGYKVTPEGITRPDGSFVPASALSTPSGMAAAGVEANAVKEVQKINTALSDELAKYNAKMSGAAAAGGGGGGAGGAHDIGPGGDEAPAAAFNPFAMSADAKAKLMAGKTVNLDGEPIGVAGANIFEMVHEAYQKKRSGAQFFEVEEPSVRSPASAPRK